MKQCIKCKENKNEEQFLNKEENICQTCTEKYIESVERKRKKSRNSALKSTYNITEEQYQELLIQQDHKCLLCGEKHTEEKKLVVDHCHTYTRVRGLLCYHCNLGLGHFKDNTKAIEKAIKYLQDSKEYKVGKVTLRLK